MLGFGIARAGQNKDTLPLSTAGLLYAWHCGDTCHGHFAVGHCKDTPRLGTAINLGAWALQGYLMGFALQGYLALRNCKDILRLGTARILGAWALQGHLVVRHCLAVGRCRDTWRLDTAGILCGWHCQHTLRLGTAIQEFSTV